MFFRNLTSVGAEMNNALLTVLSENCFLLIQSLQLSQADLPQRFEDALSATNVAIQEAITSKQTQQNVIIDMETQVNQAQIAAPVVINNAQGKVNATVATNKAQMQAFYDVTKTEAVQYERMYKALEFGSESQLLAYIKVKAINSFNPKNLIVGLNPITGAPEAKKWEL